MKKLQQKVGKQGLFQAGVGATFLNLENISGVGKFDFMYC